MSDSLLKTGRSNSVRDLFLIIGDEISFTSVAIRRCPAYGGGDLKKKKVITCLAAADPTIFLYVLVMIVSFLSLQINNSTGLDLRKY